MIEHKEEIMTKMPDDRIVQLQNWLHINIYRYAYSQIGLQHTFTLYADSQNEMFLLMRNFRERIKELDFVQ